MPRVRLDTADHDGPPTGTEQQRGIHINTDVFTLLSRDRMAKLGTQRETIDRWLDCWSGGRNG